MQYESTRIVSRIKWCRLQQSLLVVSKDECAGWRAEEAGLVDALHGRNRTALMRKKPHSQFIRYQCGLEDGQALLRIGTPIPRSIRVKGQSSARLTNTARLASRRSPASRPMYVESRR